MVKGVCLEREFLIICRCFWSLGQGDGELDVGKVGGKG